MTTKVIGVRVDPDLLAEVRENRPELKHESDATLIRVGLALLAGAIGYAIIRDAVGENPQAT